MELHRLYRTWNRKMSYVHQIYFSDELLINFLKFSDDSIPQNLDKKLFGEFFLNGQFSLVIRRGEAALKGRFFNSGRSRKGV